MNERIEELIKKCTSWSDGSTWTSREVFDKEKFSELLIRECAVWMENVTVTDSAGNKDHIGDSFFWADELKKHFGVK